LPAPLEGCSRPCISSPPRSSQPERSRAGILPDVSATGRRRTGVHFATVDPNYPAFSSPYGGCRVVTPFNMTVAVEHLAQLAIGHFQTHISSPRRLFRLDARIQSPAGRPAGLPACRCLIERVAHDVPTRIASVPVNHGVCAARVRTATAGVVNFRVTFTGAG
jgi:hypothetical protein